MKFTNHHLGEGVAVRKEKNRETISSFFKKIYFPSQFLSALVPVLIGFLLYFKLGITTGDSDDGYDRVHSSTNDRKETFCYFQGFFFLGWLVFSFDDLTSSNDWKGIKYVDSYLNPFTMEWSRLSDLQGPPTPEELRLVRAPLDMLTIEDKQCLNRVIKLSWTQSLLEYLTSHNM